MNISKPRKLLTALLLLTALTIYLYVLIGLRFDHKYLLMYALKQRILKVIVMILVALAIGGASLVFQSIINNHIVTPCLLGMNSLYSVIHTACVFFLGSGSILVTNAHLAFMLDLIIMAAVATSIYSYMFKKTKYNVLYVLLIGTVLTSLFGSMQNTMVRIKDPNEYDTLLTNLVASFDRINEELILISAVLMIIVLVIFRRELQMLDVIALGKEQAINLGIDYDRTIQKLLLGVVIYIAIATALVGPVSFIGLIIANVSRELLKTYRHRYLIMASMSIGIIVLIGGQLIVERVYHYSMPLSVFITVAGGIYFLYLLLRQRERA